MAKGRRSKAGSKEKTQLATIRFAIISFTERVKKVITICHLHLLGPSVPLCLSQWGWISWVNNITQPVRTLFLFKSIWIRPQRSQGCQKMRQDPLNMPFEVWCANIAPKLKNIQKSLRKQVFFDIFFPILMIFWSLCLSGAILAQKLNSFICKNINLIFYTPGTPGGASI